jgi:hypothetical protein
MGSCDGTAGVCEDCTAFRTRRPKGSQADFASVQAVGSLAQIHPNFLCYPIHRSRPPFPLLQWPCPLFCIDICSICGTATIIFVLLSVISCTMLLSVYCDNSVHHHVPLLASLPVTYLFPISINFVIALSSLLLPYKLSTVLLRLPATNEEDPR